MIDYKYSRYLRWNNKTEQDGEKDEISDWRAYDAIYN